MLFASDNKGKLCSFLITKSSIVWYVLVSYSQMFCKLEKSYLCFSQYHEKTLQLLQEYCMALYWVHKFTSNWSWTYFPRKLVEPTHNTCMLHQNCALLSLEWVTPWFGKINAFCTKFGFISQRNTFHRSIFIKLFCLRVNHQKYRLQHLPFWGTLLSWCPTLFAPTTTVLTN